MSASEQAAAAPALARTRKRRPRKLSGWDWIKWIFLTGLLIYATMPIIWMSNFASSRV